MKLLLQRVSAAGVTVSGKTVGKIGRGILVMVGVEPGDSETAADKMLERLLNYRIFSDDQGRMNLSLRDIGGGLLLVPQFTLAADTRSGLRPSFSSAAVPEHGMRIFQYLLQKAQQIYVPVASGCFGAHMQVSLTNDGPVTFWLES